MNAVFATAVSGMNAAMSKFARASERLVQSPAGAGDPAEAITEQIEAKTAFTANVHTIRVADDMMRALLDIGAGGQRYR
jgi:flagellar hook protein FlgE